MKIEKLILKSLLRSEDYTRKVLPFLKSEYFIEEPDRLLFDTVRDFILKYNKSPTPDALRIEIDSLSVREDVIKSINNSIDEVLQDKTETNPDWLLDNTELFCQDKAIYNAMMKSIDIMNSKNGSLSKGAIPSLLSDALSISFNPSVGHSYTEDYDKRYEYYHRKEERIPLGLELFDKITKGGLPRKTLNVLMSGPAGGKSLFMCHFASHFLSQGKNVLYITLELAEEEISKRIDANLLNVSFDDLMVMPKDMYMKKLDNLSKKTNGKLIVKEYPTSSASVIHFKSLLNELNLKKSFVPDVVFIDYIGICASARIKANSNTNSYSYLKAIAEEVRGLAVEHNVPIVTGAQVNRSGYSSSDFGMENTADSFSLPASADWMVALINTEELQELNQIMVKQLKNRYADPSQYKRFVIGIDRSKMKLYDLEAQAQVDIADSGQPQVKTSFNKDKFKQLKVN